MRERTFQVQLTTANRSCRNMSEAQPQPHSWQDQLAPSSMTLSSDAHRASPYQGRSPSTFKSELFISSLIYPHSSSWNVCQLPWPGEPTLAKSSSWESCWRDGAEKSTMSVFCISGYRARGNTNVRFPRLPYTPPWRLSQHSQGCRSRANPDTNCSRNYLFIFSSASATQILRTHRASWSQKARKGHIGEGVRGQHSKKNASLGKVL